MIRKSYNHLGLGINSVLQLFEIDGPLRSRRCSGGPVLRGVKWHISNSATGHFNVADVSFRIRQITSRLACITRTYWSKKGSKMMTSSPGSMKPMNALSIPSFAPVVMDTSVSGFRVRPKNGEYASARAFFRRGRPYHHYEHTPDCDMIFVACTLVGEYWLHSTRSRASFAASMANLGGLYPLHPWLQWLTCESRHLRGIMSLTRTLGPYSQWAGPEKRRQLR